MAEMALLMDTAHLRINRECKGSYVATKLVVYGGV